MLNGKPMQIAVSEWNATNRLYSLSGYYKLFDSIFGVYWFVVFSYQNVYITIERNDKRWHPLVPCNQIIDKNETFDWKKKHLYLLKYWFVSLCNFQHERREKTMKKTRTHSLTGDKRIDISHKLKCQSFFRVMLLPPVRLLLCYFMLLYIWACIRRNVDCRHTALDVNI